MTTRMLTAALVLTCGVVLYGQIQEPPSQDFMVRILESTSTPADVKLRVLYEARNIKPQDREPVLLNYIRDEVGRWLRYHDDSTRIPLIVGMLAEDHDPVVIPLLLGAAHFWPGASEAAADFGEDALEDAIAAANTNEIKAYAALFVLDMMMERQTVRKPLSWSARTRVTALIGSKLRGRQELAVALTAIHLAAKSGNPELVARVKQLAQDAHELSGDPEQVQQLQRAAIEVFASPEPRAHPEIHLIPAGYAGFVTIAFMASAGEPGDFEGNARLYRIPTNGLLLVPSPPNHGLGPEQRFFIVEPNGDRREVRISVASFSEMLENRIHPDVEVFNPTKGVVQGERCNIEYDQYFIGTRAQFLDADASLEVASKNLERTFKCP